MRTIEEGRKVHKEIQAISFRLFIKTGKLIIIIQFAYQLPEECLSM